MPLRRRTVTRAGRFEIVRNGSYFDFFGDGYHLLLKMRWGWFLAALSAMYVISNAAFAVLYLLGGDCIANARPGNWLDYYFFSVQTLATIGYGGMTPTTTYANFIVSIESLWGILATAATAGLFFARLARPTARIEFSTKCAVILRDGVPHLVFRMANQRANQIVEARAAVTLNRTVQIKEGGQFRQILDLPLVRDTNPIFVFTWVVMHKIERHSPLWGLSEAQIAESDMEIFATVVGVDEDLNAQVFARKNWPMSDVMLGGRFADMLMTGPDGRRIVDGDRLNDIEFDPNLYPRWE